MMPNLITYSTLIRTCEKTKSLEKALEIFDAMQRQAVLSDVVIYNILITACGKIKQSQLDLALTLFKTMR